MEKFKEESMQKKIKKSESMSLHAFSQYELTTEIITKLNTFKLTPTAKLVLLYLTTCYNPKHKEVFPKQKTIAIKLGISERSVTRAVQELFNAGLVLIECKYTNRYKFTSKIVSNTPHLPDENLSDDLGQNDIKEGDNLSHHEIEPTIEHDKEPQRNNNKGGNVYQYDDAILADYAVKHGAKNIRAYIAKLKETKSAEKIICEYKNAKNATKKALRSIEETQNLIREYESFKENAQNPKNVSAWIEYGKKFGYKR